MKINQEEVSTFLNGRDPMEHIITIECGYDEDEVSIIYCDEEGKRRKRVEPFTPFVWAKASIAKQMFKGDRQRLIKRMMAYGINCKGLKTSVNGDKVPERLENGYKLLFYATKKMSYQTFQKFFNEAGTPISTKKKDNNPKEDKKEFLAVSPVEQYMMKTGKRLFKGWEGYDDLLRFIFDLETRGLNPKKDRIEQIGIRTNKGYEKIISIEGNTKEELDRSELNGIIELVKTIKELKPHIIIGQNSENFDWYFIIVRCEELGTSFEKITKDILGFPIYKKQKETVLKLGGETEYYKPTIIWGHSVIDSLHSIRRAQALDSNMKSANLKYVTKYLNLNKPNRVYVKGNAITTTWNEQDNVFAFNDKNGEWKKVDKDYKLGEDEELVNGRYIVKRYLMDDLYETDKVELKLNESNFLVAKILPTTFSRVCTMGTAGIWKLIMLAWSYENNLAIPAFGVNRKFVGGLSRLLKTGYVDRIVKLDYNSLYPSVILTWNIENKVDSANVLNTILFYVLTQREKYKQLKADAGKKVDELKEKLKTCSPSEKEKIEEEIKYWKSEKSGNDKKQLPLKILGNSYFGSAGAEHLFPWGDNTAAETTTCISRMLLRLMISHFSSKEIGYKPVVGDSFTPDTPLFVKYDETGFIDIKPISEIFNASESYIDALGREYDTSYKPYKVLCRSGWMEPKYIYRHKTNKPLYTVSDTDMSVTVTEDHSLFNDKQEKIKPSEIDKDTKLEYYQGEIKGDSNRVMIMNEKRAKHFANWLKEGKTDRVALPMLNTDNIDAIKTYLDALKDFDLSKASKTCMAGIIFLKKKLTSN